MYYPIMLKLTNKRCTVVGGGRVAERKIKTLLQHGGHVTVISPELTEGLTALAAEEKIHWLRCSYKAGHLKGSNLVIVATNNPQVSRACCEEAKAFGILINVVDLPELGDFIVPANHRQGDLTISVSTEGKSPMLSREIRRELAERYDSSYGHLVDILGQIREQAQVEIQNSHSRKRLYEILVQEGLRGNRDLWQTYEVFKCKEGEETNEDN